VTRISPATVTFCVMAIVLGLVGAYVVRKALQKEPVVVAPRPVPKVDPGIPVVFYKANTARNTRIGPDDVFLGHVPKGTKAAEGDALHILDRALGRITKTTLKSGMAVREKDLLEFGETLPDLSDRLPEGHRAITIDVVGATTGGKRLAEGDHIDITLTVEGTHPDLGEVTTKTLLKDILVMDSIMDRPLQRGIRRANGIITEGITVAVNPEDANKLVVAERTGTLGAVLRSSKDVGEVDHNAQAINRRELLGLKPIPPPKPIPVPKPQKTFRIEHYSGSKVSVQEFDGDRVRESRTGPSGKQFDEETDPQAAHPSQTDDKNASPQSGVQIPAIVGVEDVN
jgi:pilus assembly protein CpaB